MTAAVRSSQGIRTGPPVSSTTTVCGLARATRLYQRVLPDREARGSARRRPPSATGRRMTTPHRRRSGGPGRPRGIAAVVVVDAGARKLPADRIERRRRIEDHRAILAPRLRSSAIPPRGTTCDEPPPDGTPRSACAPTTRMRRTSAGSGNRPWLLAAGPRLPLDRERGLVAHRRSQRDRRRRLVRKSAGEDRSQNPARHVVEPGLRDFALSRPTHPRLVEEVSGVELSPDSWSRPARAERTVEWTAPQSDITKPG